MRRWGRHSRRPSGDPPISSRSNGEGRIAVFAPSPLLTITIEPGSDRPEVHLHGGGQGLWVARLAATLGADVVLCCALGGESGGVLRGLIEAESLTLRAARAETANGVYIHDRRSGSRLEVVNVESQPLDRHTSDELYGIALAAGLDADLTLITGCQPVDLLPADLYRRLVSDLHANGKQVIADLTGPPLSATLAGGVALLRLSEEEMLRDDNIAGDALTDLIDGARRLQDAGASNVLISRASAPAILVGDAEPSTQIELAGPVFEALDHSGAGDSMFAATGVGLSRGMEMLDALRLGMAAGALNATRRGLGTGTRQEIERLATHVTVRTAKQSDGSREARPAHIRDGDAS